MSWLPGRRGLTLDAYESLFVSSDAEMYYVGLPLCATWRVRNPAAAGWPRAHTLSGLLSYRGSSHAPRNVADPQLT